MFRLLCFEEKEGDVKYVVVSLWVGVILQLMVVNLCYRINPSIQGYIIITGLSVCVCR